MPRQNLAPVISKGVMTGSATLTSIAFDGRYMEQIKAQVVFTGTPTGTFKLNQSMDYNPGTGLGTWNDTGVSISAAAGSGSSQTVNFPNQGPAFYQIVYVNSGGTGVLYAYIGGLGPS